MQQTFDITVSTEVDCRRLSSFLNTFNMKASVTSKAIIKIEYNPSQINEKLILKIVGMFGKSRTGRKTKVVTVSLPKPL